MSYWRTESAAEARNKLGDKNKIQPMGDKLRVLKVRQIIERWNTGYGRHSYQMDADYLREIAEAVR